MWNAESTTTMRIQMAGYGKTRAPFRACNTKGVYPCRARGSCRVNFRLGLSPTNLDFPGLGVDLVRPSSKSSYCGWTKSISHHLRNPGMIRFPCKCQQAMVSSMVSPRGAVSGLRDHPHGSDFDPSAQDPQRSAAPSLLLRGFRGPEGPSGGPGSNSTRLSASGWGGAAEGGAAWDCVSCFCFFGLSSTKLGST